jgi:hypothetical protein
MKRIWLIVFLGFFSCTSDFEKGQEKFEAGEYEEAQQFFKNIRQTDNDFSKATQRLIEIDSILTGQVYQLAVQRFSEGSDQDSKVLFLRIHRSSYFYFGAQKYLQRIDSIENVRKLESANNDKERKGSTDLELKEAKEKMRALFNELIGFKNESEFQRNGFAVGSKYNLWLKKVQELKNSRTEELVINLGFVPGDLEMLGLEYVKTKGKETEYSLWARKTITDGLKE